MTSPITHLTIIGLGLLGSSLARIFRQAWPECHITGCNHSQATLDKALELGIIHAGTTDAAQAAQKADMVVLCTPMGTYETYAKTIAPVLKGRAILTDIGSVKQYALDAIMPHLKTEHQKRFVAGHPIAGSEKSGVEAGNTDIFKGKRIILTPLPSTEAEAVAKVKEMWEVTGAYVETLEAARHDHIYAHVSHLVQLAITSYGLALGEELKGKQEEIARRFIRIAGANPAMWRDICITNRDAILEAITTFRKYLEGLKKRIETGELPLEELKEGRKKRSAFMQEEESNYLPTLFVPQLIACALVQSVPEEYLPYSGTGFRDATAIIAGMALPGTLTHQEEMLADLDIYLHQLELLTTAIWKKEGDMIGKLLGSSIHN